jgi:serine/threonine protein kinase
MDRTAWAAPDRATPDAARTRLEAALAGRYRIEERIGRGQFSSVFRATDIDHAGEVAIKLLDVDVSTTPELVQRLEEMRSLCASLHDEGVVVASSLEQHESRAFLVMPFMHGGSLAELLRMRGTPSLAEVERIVGEVAATLDRIHAHGLTHRGLTPENILFDFSGRSCITDIGVTDSLLAAHAGDGSRAARARAYAAPELRRAQPVDGRADQYALAMIAYEMLTGGKLLRRQTFEGIITLDPIEVLAEVPLCKDVPVHVNAALRRALSAGAANRFATTRQFAEALVGRGAAPTRGLPTTLVELLLRRRPRAYKTIGAVVALLAITMIATPSLRISMRTLWRTATDDLADSQRRVEVSVEAASALAEAPAAPPAGSPTGQRASSNVDGGPHTGSPRAGASHAASPTPGRSVATDSSATMASEPIKVRLDASSSATPSTNPPGGAIVASEGRVAQHDTRSWLARLFQGSSPASSPPSAYIRVAVDRGTPLVSIDGVARGIAPLTASVNAGHHTVAVQGSIDYRAPTTGVIAAPRDTVSVSFRSVAAP